MIKLQRKSCIGLTVTAIIYDLGSNFIKLARELNITPEKPWFIHDRVGIIYIFDPPHLIKAVPNNMMNYEFHFEQKVFYFLNIIFVFNPITNLIPSVLSTLLVPSDCPTMPVVSLSCFCQTILLVKGRLGVIGLLLFVNC